MGTLMFIVATLLIAVLFVSYRVYRQRIAKDRHVLYLDQTNTAYVGLRHGRIGVIPFFTKTS